jgi:hypothetical protein
MKGKHLINELSELHQRLAKPGKSGNINARIHEYICEADYVS